MRPLHTAEILAVGSEMLTPFRIDTNSLYLTGQLNELGIDVRAKAIVGDDRGDLSSLLRQALSRADVVMTTGGLGPTEDDLTREVVADVIERPLQEDPAILAALEDRFVRRKIAMPRNNRRQAQVPLGAVVLDNPHGSAPGLWIETGGRILVLFPGPPREMQPMFETHVAPRLAAFTTGRRVRRRVIKITGYAESLVDEKAQPIYTPLLHAPVPIETTILAAPGQIELHLSARGTDIPAMDAALEHAVGDLAAALAPGVFSVDGRSLEEVVGQTLKARGLRIAAAESCTAGLLLGRLTEVPGSSNWVIGGVVAYDNAVKVRDLGVPQALLDAHGAVSEPVAVAMAEGARMKFGADVAVSVTGIAGPDGGTPEKPVGTVVIAIAMAGKPTTTRTLALLGSRQMIRHHSTSAALDMVRRGLAG
jgi:nicotinamide-nucleotide amidase